MNVHVLLVLILLTRIRMKAISKISSIVVVLAYIFVVNNLDLQIPEVYIKYGTAIALGILAFILWKEKDEDLVKLNIDISMMIITLHQNIIMHIIAFLAC